MANRLYRSTVSMAEPVGLIGGVGLEVRINWITASWECKAAGPKGYWTPMGPANDRGSTPISRIHR